MSFLPSMTGLRPQSWERDSDGPCLSLGAPGSFDDMHLFAPCVIFEDGRYTMWYSGSRGTVDERVFVLGRADSADGIRFERHPAAPVMRLADGQSSILTPSLLRHPGGSVCREGGRLRLWYSSCNFPARDSRHTLHETSSSDGLSWSPPSPPELDAVYAPTVIKESGRYRLWYADVTVDPWIIRAAESADGRCWQVAAEPALILDQAWEHQRLFYPTVLKLEDDYLMWYGSYTHAAGEPMRTALGLAVSRDGWRWRKLASNPVFGPDPAREWESHFTTSQSILRLPDGSWRIWYATRPRPPFEHKYFAIGTARWHPAGAACL